MMDEDKLIEQIKSTLEKNNFPAQKVSLPYSKILASVENLELDMELFLGRLELFNIYTYQDGDRLICSPTPKLTTNDNSTDDIQNILGGNNLDQLKNMNKEDLMKTINKVMSNMTPEQTEKIKNMYENMTPEQQQEIMQKSKDLNLS